MFIYQINNNIYFSIYGDMFIAENKQSERGHIIAF